MPTIENQSLYEEVKAEADKKYDKPSAYKSGWIVKEYKKRGGTYKGKKDEKKGLARWYKEEWADIGGKDYPVYRPTKRITKDTPLTASEIDPKQAKKQIKKKQVIKGDKNLPPFQMKGGACGKRECECLTGDGAFYPPKDPDNEYADNRVVVSHRANRQLPYF